MLGRHRGSLQVFGNNYTPIMHWATASPTVAHAHRWVHSWIERRCAPLLPALPLADGWRRSETMAEAFRIGMGVTASNGDVGKVEDVLYDRDGQARYLVVRDQGVFGSDAVLPVDGAQASGDTVRYALSKDQIRAADRYDPLKYGSAAGLVSGAAGQYDQQDDH